MRPAELTLRYPTKHNRRYFGVAAFGQALLHTSFYFLDKASHAAVMNDLPRPNIEVERDPAAGQFLPISETGRHEFASAVVGQATQNHHKVHLVAVPNQIRPSKCRRGDVGADFIRA